ncbi:DinB family protein [Streptomyces sp. NPDC059698]|uniref:DinB family protein n=1 Tax=unclassified Streptomyces TaxID=2593676 RepID=UPI000938AD17|nr:DinB family protein [Streptomyces sp. CB02366]OKJ36805.1 Mini-circle protein [Streptomyces sp. CB02366]TVP35901.1 Mini-circle protein [Streptomyces griseus subsp. griseus]
MTWTAPRPRRTVHLTDLATLDERPTLQGWLTWHRETLLAKCAGLDGKQLARTTAEPSTLTLLGLVRHLAEVERSWFRRMLDGESVGEVHDGPADGDEGLEGVEPAHAERDFARYHAEIAACDAAAARYALDDTFQPPGVDVPLSLRWLYVLMIQEYARHNGHADLLRERTDGATGD